MACVSPGSGDLQVLTNLLCTGRCCILRLCKPCCAFSWDSCDAEMQRYSASRWRRNRRGLCLFPLGIPWGFHASGVLVAVLEARGDKAITSQHRQPWALSSIQGQKAALPSSSACRITENLQKIQLCPSHPCSFFLFSVLFTTPTPHWAYSCACFLLCSKAVFLRPLGGRWFVLVLNPGFWDWCKTDSLHEKSRWLLRSSNMKWEYSSPCRWLTKILNSDSPLLTVSSAHKFKITPFSILFYLRKNKRSKVVLCITVLNWSSGEVC